jgi:hypothetical protein
MSEFYAKPVVAKSLEEKKEEKKELDKHIEQEEDEELSEDEQARQDEVAMKAQYLPGKIISTANSEAIRKFACEKRFVLLSGWTKEGTSKFLQWLKSPKLEDAEAIKQRDIAFGNMLQQELKSSDVTNGFGELALEDLQRRRYCDAI